MGSIHVFKGDLSFPPGNTDIGGTRVHVHCLWCLYYCCHNICGLMRPWWPPQRVQPHPQLLLSACQECVWELQGPSLVSVRSAQDYMRNVIQSTCCASYCWWGEKQQPAPSLWPRTLREQLLQGAGYAQRWLRKAVISKYQGHFGFPVFFAIFFLQSLNSRYASFPYPSEIFSYWRK